MGTACQPPFGSASPRTAEARSDSYLLRAFRRLTSPDSATSRVTIGVRSPCAGREAALQPTPRTTAGRGYARRVTFSRLLAATGAGLLLLAGCTPSSATPPATSTGTTGATASPSATALDLTEPGAARRLIGQLVQASGGDQVIFVSIKRHEATVSVLVHGQPATWAYRDAQVAQVPSDLAYVGQAHFDPDAFALDDVGALFRAASAVSGSASEQDLQIVDQHRVEHDAADVTMSVSTNPESRTVFFYRDGSLVPTLDFNTAEGISTGLSDAMGRRTSVTAVSVGSAAGAAVTYTAADETTVVRTRSSRVPATDVPRSSHDTRTAFDPNDVSPSVIWRVLQRYADDGAFGPTTVWSVTAEVRTPGTQPRLRFTVGSATLVTDLVGTEVTQ